MDALPSGKQCPSILKKTDDYIFGIFGVQKMGNNAYVKIAKKRHFRARGEYYSMKIIWQIIIPLSRQKKVSLTLSTYQNTLFPTPQEWTFFKLSSIITYTIPAYPALCTELTAFKTLEHLKIFFSSVLCACSIKIKSLL